MTDYRWQLIDAGNDEVAEADPDIRAAKEKYLKREGSIWEITRQKEGITYATTGTKSELVELERNMRGLIIEGAYGYRYIESLLISFGYQLATIRATFRKLTGVDPEAYVDTQRYLDTPGTIPGINYGWGKSKDASYDYYFVMPWKFGYEIFGQKGDLQRDEVSFFTGLPEAKKKLEKKVVELFYYDKPVSEKNIKVLEEDQTELTEPFPLGLGPVKVTSQYKKLSDYLYSLKDSLPDNEKKSMIEGALEVGEIDKEQYEALMIEAGLKESVLKTKAEPEEEGVKKTLEEDTEELAEKVKKEPYESYKEENTPQDFFEKSKPDMPEGKAQDIIDKILSYIGQKNKELMEFSVSYKSFKYMTRELDERIERTLKVPGQEVEEIFSSDAVVAVELIVSDETLATNVNEKRGLIVFTVISGDIITDDNFKGEDNRIYGLTDAGLQNYFRGERIFQEQEETE